ncbi:DUF1178 family protein [Phreatobacter cathodiphilus]|uniref:DUF1178 domain-containing protein n=1 Tax=Phreatobacter cathodiphilus TaxID=1868589 RepID=A0A2S0NGP4_9HYPH|nr:DUF1178 family protein [Phreatobacter cathodiphilus]AVO47339.1 DUF1178 domain-containing protein [Phreatobacter cathodiphilus]
MIRYALHCDKAHEFESWFPSSDSYEAQRKQGFVACPVCGSTRIDKALMAPQVARKDRAPVAEPATPTPPPSPVAVVSPVEQELRAKLRELREHIVKTADPVGERFAEEARKIHYGETEHRSIYGQATPEEARELAEEGIEFHALPVLPDDRN